MIIFIYCNLVLNSDMFCRVTSKSLHIFTFFASQLDLFEGCVLKLPKPIADKAFAQFFYDLSIILKVNCAIKFEFFQT